ncbi:DUF177 domain-containing protein [Methylobacterium sp. BTF04]|uniref:YceD family protein n=1 Tax=Methylobacterium sp. BTF04 TaxID=2708300 RepID=UPI0013D7DD39|nr:DUF177 domain-containing protein [Methylobacterium sp. BTF04]NEU10919.1 DUF177 domain-containing protein [Methylobacterium sp. BTF04]
MTQDVTVGPLSQIVRVDRAPRGDGIITVTATPEQCAALAADFKIPAIRDLVGRFSFTGSLSDLKVTGTVEAWATQICTVSLDPFESKLSEPVEVTFTDTDVLVGTDAEDADVPDPIVNGRIDFGKLTAEFLALGLDPYPRKPGIAFEPPADAGDDLPFAALKRLRSEESQG